MLSHCSVGPLFFSLLRQVGHLSERQLAFFSHWDRTIDLEAKIGEQVNHDTTREHLGEVFDRGCA